MEVIMTNINIFSLEFFSVIMFFISFYGIITSQNIIKSIVCITLLEMAVIMFIVSIGFKEGMVPPIGQNLENTSDPLPQALMITAIVIGVAVSAVSLTMLISIYRQYKSTDWDAIKKKNME
jgi:multicomponent Na+:H+ antiporter subunit C